MASLSADGCPSSLHLSDGERKFAIFQKQITQQQVRGCGVSAVDLRPSLRAAKDVGQLYRRTDTHWTALGALIAYNRVVAAMGRPDFAIPLAGVRWTSATRLDGDLPRYAGRSPIPETVMSPDILQLPESARHTTLSGFHAKLEPSSISSSVSGPTVLIIGDSFTAFYFPAYFAHFVSRVVWMHQEDCRFDWNVVASVKPDIVLLMPTERFARCPGGGRPVNYVSEPRSDVQRTSASVGYSRRIGFHEIGTRSSLHLQHW